MTRRDRGFSLIELLVALLILTLVITMSITAFAERKRRMQQASEIILAYQALANEAEYRRRIDFDSLENDTEFMSDVTLLEPLIPFQTAVHVDDTPHDGIRNVTIILRWREGRQEARLGLIRVKTGGTNLW